MALTPVQVRVARRISWLRESKNMKQEDLAAAMGFKNRQTLTSAEALERPLAPQEVAAAARALGVSVDVLLDPFQLVGEGEFNFRVAKDVEEDTVLDFQDLAGQWIATFRELAVQTGSAPKTLGQKLELPDRPSYEEVQSRAEALWREWGLGETPASRLEEALEARLGVLVLYVEAPTGVSGAAVHLPGLQVILINRRESEGRRSFDLAHELFHVLTWDTFRPKFRDPIEPSKVKGNRVEELAENFAAALLMPAPVVAARWAARGRVPLEDWLVVTAHALQVSPVALRWRLVNLELLPKAELTTPKPSGLAPAAAPGVRPAPPRLFSASFVSRVHEGVEAGRLSLNRASSLLQLTIPEFAALCRDYGKSLSYDLTV